MIVLTENKTEAATYNAVINRQAYANLLTRALPGVIHTEEENERMLEEIWQLMKKGEENVTPEESRLLELMCLLVEKFEAEHYPFPESKPHELLQFIMEERGLRQRDLLPVFGSDGLTSDVVNGKRAISKDKAKKLAEFLGVSVELFL